MTSEPTVEARAGQQVVAVARTEGPDQTKALAAAVADVLADGDLLVLTGDLGAGKTCFTQGLGVGLGVEDRITSPTFTLAGRYQGRLVLNHLDVYRLDSLAETIDLGLGELLEDGVTVIEWGDKITDVLPVDHLLITLRYPDDPTADPDERLIEFVAPVGRGGNGSLVDAVAPWRVER